MRSGSDEYPDVKAYNNKLQKYQTNIYLYLYFRMASDGLAWIAVFFLYMSSMLPLDRVIQLSAIYYLSVFILEVPSGYFSDRFGRRTTLLLAAASMILAYAFSLLSAIVMAMLVWQFSEPEHSQSSADEDLYKGFFNVLKACFARLRDPVLLWIFLVMIALYALAHIVYEFYQPYISLLDISLFDASEYAPLVSGVVISISMFGGALAARVSVGWHRKLGLVGLFLLAAIIQLSIVGSMALLLHSSILILICARNFPMSLLHAPVNAAIAPRIASAQRATYLSVQGLSERVVFALLLLILSGGLVKGQPVNETALVDILVHTFLAGAVVIGLLFLFGGRIRKLLR